ncbi:putative alpha beta hydrolase [Rosellinia necatrix]|uniref:Putative alpha beta hydrolase n=1 Tax=Rosellinia necatrix TaxID=77044 RepID=A0A1S7UP76_ROSNE|nr:putative alpha beta hydrolase [Rosellinia necatrix]
MPTQPPLKTVRTPALEIAYHEHGPPDGWPVVLAHGFPYSPVAYDEVAPRLARAGARVIVPYARGFGATRFLDDDDDGRRAMRNGQQAALAADLVALLDALGIARATLAGFDWGGLAACCAAALWPGRVAALVSYAGYDVAAVGRHSGGEDGVGDGDGDDAPSPALECVMWYQHLFQSERGRACLARDRRRLCRLLWAQWSPSWDPAAADAAFARAAPAFDNADFVDVVVHCYRFVHGAAAGDPALDGLEARLAARPRIAVPCVTLDGARDPLKPGGSAAHAPMFAARHERRVVDVGHAFPAEAPEAFARAVIDAHAWAVEAGTA